MDHLRSGSNTLTLNERDIRFHFHPATNPAAHERKGPLIVDHAEGIYFVDDKGNRLLDMHSSLWCTSLGYSEHRLRDVAAKQFDRLASGHTFGHRSSEPVIELAETLIGHAPVPMSKVQFQCSGSEANDTAVKMVWFYWHSLGKTERRKIIARTKGYHGTTAVAASMSHFSYMNGPFGLPLPGFVHVDNPDIYRGPQPGESDVQYAARLADQLEQTILREGPETIGAFIAEPVMGAGGLYPPPAGYFEKIQEVLDRYGILFIADEVICGFGRLGQWWGSQAYNAKPDIITCAKALTAGYLPLSATMINEKVYEVLRQGSEAANVFGHGYTYSGHPVCAAVALETLRIYEDDRIIEGAAKRGEYLGERLKSLADHPLVGNIRGAGLMFGVELVKDKASKLGFEAVEQAGTKMQDICWRRGLNTRALNGITMAFTPPLIITNEEIDEAINIFAAALGELQSQLVSEGILN